MTLTPNLVRSTITSPGTESDWTDETIYGGSGPDRNEVALWLTAYKMDENQVATALSVTTFDPETVVDFVTTNTIDGWYKYNLIIAPYWSNGTENVKYDIVWATDEQAFYQYINDTPSTGNYVTDTTYYSPITDPTTVIANVGTSSESLNIVYQVINKIVDFQTSICYLKATSKHAIESCNKGSCGCDTRLGKYYHIIRDLFANLPVNESTGLFIQGEQNARLAEKYCDDCGCITR